MAPSAVEDIISTTVPALSKAVKSMGGEKHEHADLGVATLNSLSFGDYTLPGIPKFTSKSEERQWQLEHMAAAFRHWSREGYVEGISGHISVRDPEYHDCFWTNPFGVHFGLLKASDMVLVNLDGKIVGGKPAPLNPAGFYIHAAIHKVRPDVHAICHAHTVHGKAWSVFGRELELLTQDTCKFYKSHSVYNAYGGIVLADDEGERIAAALGPTNKACILRNHGLLTVGSTVDEAAFLFTSLEHACEGQLLCDTAVNNDRTGTLRKVLISDEEAAYNFAADSSPDVCYAEFQPYYEYENYTLKGEFKN